MDKTYGSFSKRLTRSIMLVQLVTIIFVALFVILSASIALQTMTRGFFLSELQVVNESIEKRLNSVEVATNISVVDIMSQLGSPETIYTSFEEELKPNDKLIIGFAAAFEPYYFPNQGKWFEPYVYRQNGKINRMQIGSETHDYFNKEWYHKALQAKKGYWSDPYFDDAVTQTLMCSYFVPIRDENKQKIGVFGADFSIEWLYDRLKKMDTLINDYLPLVPVKTSENDENRWAYNLLIDGKGTFIYHPEKERILKDNFFEAIKESSDTLYNQLTRSIANGEKGYQEIKVDGKSCYIFHTSVKHTNWSNLIVIPKEGFLIPTIVIVVILLAIIATGLLLAYWISRRNICRATEPLHMLAKSADEVAKGNFQAPLPKLEHDDEIGLLRDSFGNMQQSLTQYIEQLKITTAEKTVIESELNIGRKIQMSMVPNTFPEHPKFEIYGMMTPAKAVGGDLYDFFIQDQLLYFCIGDVSGKGVPAALLMSVTRSLFRAYSNNERMPNHIMSRMNKALCENNEQNMFVTLFIGILDLSSGTLFYCNAGHEPPILIHNEAQQLDVEPLLPVGAIDDTVYQMQTIYIQSDTTILLYTDGLDEAMDAENKQFGRKRIMEELEAAIAERQVAPQPLTERMSHAVHEFVGDTEQSDDLTMLVIKRK